MGLVLDRLLLLAAPLYAAAVASKKKRVKKPAKKKHKSTPARSAAKRVRAKKPARRAAYPSPKRKSFDKKGAAHGRLKLPLRPPFKPVYKAPPAAQVPEPKPVAPTGRPILLSPEQGKYADSVNPKFRWLSVGTATRYEVNWSQDANHANAYSVISMATEAAVPVEKPLAIGVVYYWRARGGNEAGWGPWSNTGSFSVLEETE